jgi:hypothetical protein
MIVSAPLYDYIIIFYLGGTYVSHFFIAVQFESVYFDEKYQKEMKYRVVVI